MSQIQRPTPLCPKCGGNSFAAVKDDQIEAADFAVAFIVCSSRVCNTLIGVLPYESVWEK